jgi:cyclopropane fatty-acyl-phospholipid synthase-like methyltransferase
MTDQLKVRGAHCRFLIGVRCQPRSCLLRIREAGLRDHCRVEICDYGDIDTSREYDKVVSVGMFEHVGQALLPDYFRQAWNLLRSGGVFLNHE